MNEICIHVPSLRENQTVDVEVTVNGKKQIMSYRVESFDWTIGGRELTGRIERLRSLIEGYEERLGARTDWYTGRRSGPRDVQKA